jgi:cobalamin biosynthesis protein CobT
MEGHKLDLAAKTSIILGEILSQLGIPFAVNGFSTRDGHMGGSRSSRASDLERKTYTRWGDLWIGDYKGFDESWANSSHRLINMRRNAKYNTYDGESLRYGAQVLLARPEKRKILFWLNDGEPYPNAGDDFRAHERYAKDCATEVEKLVELFAIGVNTDAVKRFYKNYVVVNRLEDLPTVCLGELDALLRQGKTLKAA